MAYTYTTTDTAYSGDTLYAKAIPLNTGTWATGVVAMTELSTTGSFSATLDESTEYVIYLQAGGSPASTDTSVGQVAAKSPTIDIQATTPTVERPATDTDDIRFSWPTDGATITGEVSKAGGAYVAVTGAITQRADDGGFWYQLAYNAADRQSGSQRYKFTDGVSTGYVNLNVYTAPDNASIVAIYEDTNVTIPAELEKLPGVGRTKRRTIVGGQTIDETISDVS